MSQSNEEEPNRTSIATIRRRLRELKEYTEDKAIELEDQMLVHERHFVELQGELQTLKDILLKNTEAMQEYIEVAKTAKYFFKTVRFVERACVWVAKVAAAVGIVVGAWQFAVKQAFASIVSKG